MARKCRRALREAFGLTEVGLPDLPRKVGNVRLARLVWLRSRGGCSSCFPHGSETTNSSRAKNRRSWKNYRLTRYRPVAG